ncbi:MAG: OmpA family protein [Flavobacteriales bacterium]|nr:OmpA family protein [Flavobacteriales bacterium]
MKRFYIILIALLMVHNALQAQRKLKASNDSALVSVKVMDLQDHPILFADLEVTLSPTNTKIKSKTNNKGVAEFLMPRPGNLTYSFIVDYRGDHHSWDRQFKIPQDKGAYDLSVKLKYEPKHVVLYEVAFDPNSAHLKESSDRELRDLLELMSDKPHMQIEILGHTDSIGSIEHNMKLSLERANAIKQYLVDGGIQEHRIKTSGHGPLVPIDTNTTEEGRARNRRIEVKVLKE